MNSSIRIVLFSRYFSSRRGYYPSGTFTRTHNIGGGKLRETRLSHVVLCTIYYTKLSRKKIPDNMGREWVRSIEINGYTGGRKSGTNVK